MIIDLRAGRQGSARPKGRPLEDDALTEVRPAMDVSAYRRDLLIEYLHALQDRFGCLHTRHIKALASTAGRAASSGPI